MDTDRRGIARLVLISMQYRGKHSYCGALIDRPMVDIKVRGDRITGMAKESLNHGQRYTLARQCACERMSGAMRREWGSELQPSNGTGHDALDCMRGDRVSVSSVEYEPVFRPVRPANLPLAALFGIVSAEDRHRFRYQRDPAPSGRFCLPS